MRVRHSASVLLTPQRVFGMYMLYIIPYSLGGAACRRDPGLALRGYSSADRFLSALAARLSSSPAPTNRKEITCFRPYPLSLPDVSMFTRAMPSCKFACDQQLKPQGGVEAGYFIRCGRRASHDSHPGILRGVRPMSIHIVGRKA